MSVGVVVPTCRGFKIPEQTRADVDWYIVHDRQRWPVDGRAYHIIAPDQAMFGRRCDSIRSAGFLWAAAHGAKYILTVDDDCHLPRDWAEQHVSTLERLVHPWSFTAGFKCRGIPDFTDGVPVALSHGLWDGVPDLSGVDQIGKTYREIARRMDGVVRRIHPPFPQSAMNFGFVRDVLWAMYQPAQGEGTPYDRYADIWGGVLAQRVLANAGWAFMNGAAVVYHDRMSDPHKNVAKEKPGDEIHSRFWRWVWSYDHSDYEGLADSVLEFSLTLEGACRNYFRQLASNMRTWVSLTDEAYRLSSRAGSRPSAYTEHSTPSGTVLTCPTNWLSTREDNVSLRIETADYKTRVVT